MHAAIDHLAHRVGDQRIAQKQGKVGLVKFGRDLFGKLDAGPAVGADHRQFQQDQALGNRFDVVRKRKILAGKIIAEDGDNLFPGKAAGGNRRGDRRNLGARGVILDRRARPDADAGATAEVDLDGRRRCL